MVFQYLSISQPQVGAANGPSRMHGGLGSAPSGSAIHLRSPGTHQLYAAASAGCNGPTPPPPSSHHAHMGSAGPAGGHHHTAQRMPPAQLMASNPGMTSNGAGVKPHPLGGSPGQGPSAYVSSSANPYYVDLSPGYHGECDEDRTPPTPMWPSSSSLSPPSARGGGGAGMRSSPPLRGVSGSAMGCHGGAGGGGGLGYKDRSRQASLDEGRVGNGGGGGGGGGCGARSMRCNSDGAQMLVSSGSSCGNNNSGDEFSLDLKKVGAALGNFVLAWVVAGGTSWL